MISDWSFNSRCVQNSQDGLLVFFKLVVFCYHPLIPKPLAGSTLSAAVDVPYGHHVDVFDHVDQKQSPTFVLVAIMQKILHGVPPDGRMDSAASEVTETVSWDATELLNSAKHHELDVNIGLRCCLISYSVCINIHRYRSGPLSPRTEVFRDITQPGRVDSGTFLTFSPPMIFCFHIKKNLFFWWHISAQHTLGECVHKYAANSGCW